MATNKHAIIRYQALDRCFRNTGRKYYVDDLIKACNKAIYKYFYEHTGLRSSLEIKKEIEALEFGSNGQEGIAELLKELLG